MVNPVTERLPVIETERLVLRMGTPEDVARIVRFQRDNDQFLTPWSPKREPESLTEEFWRKQVETNAQDYLADRALRFFIFRKDAETRIVGACNFANFVRGAGQYCTVGFCLAEEAQGRGYMTEALQAGIGFVFRNLNMHRIQAGYMPRNERSGKLLARLGFKVEGHAPEYLCINGKWEDHIITSLINSAWQHGDLR